MSNQHGTLDALCRIRHPLTPREKVARAIQAHDNDHVPDGYADGLSDEVSDWSAYLADRVLTALASGSGDHAELARLAEAATKGPWVCKEGSTSYPECDDKDFWSVVLSPAGKEIVTLHERYASKSDDRGDYDFDAAFIAAANPATILSLLAENAALRASVVKANDGFEEYERRFYLEQERATEAERKLAEAVGLLRECLPWVRKITDLYGLVSAWLSREAERG